jgi:thiamine-phosphate pyrophosphorylase
LSLPQAPVLLITDRLQARVPLEEVAAAAFEGGCRWLLVRDKDLPGPERVALARRLIALGRPLGAKVLMSADCEAVLAAGADGVHLPRDGDPAATRARLGGGALIGISAHGLAEAAGAAAGGADYATLSPIFETASKPGYGPALGPAGMSEVARRVALPILALGGITGERAGPCLAAGAAGVAVMGGVLAAGDPRMAMADLIAACTEADTT